jgi:hypothetical protein
MSTLNNACKLLFAAEAFGGAVNNVQLTFQTHHCARDASTVSALDINQDALAREQV